MKFILYIFTTRNQIATTKIVEARCQSTQWVIGKYVLSTIKVRNVILKMFNWSESSRTVIFFSKEFGKLPLIDKGGRSFKSKRGRLQSFSQLGLTFYSSEKESSGYISDIELIKMYSFEKEGTLGRLAYASAACELLNLLLPQGQTQETLYI